MLVRGEYILNLKVNAQFNDKKMKCESASKVLLAHSINFKVMSTYKILLCKLNLYKESHD